MTRSLLSQLKAVHPGPPSTLVEKSSPGSPPARRSPGLVLLFTCLAIFLAASPLFAVDYVIDTRQNANDPVTISKNGSTPVLVGDTDFGGEILSINRLIDGNAQIVQIMIGGDFILNAGDTLRGIGRYPVELFVGNDVIIHPHPNPNVITLDFSGIDLVAGAGGGTGQPGGIGGFGGFGGSGGNGGEGGKGGSGGLSIPIPFVSPYIPLTITTPGFMAEPGGDGEPGDFGGSGNPGAQGRSGRLGFPFDLQSAGGGGGTPGPVAPPDESDPLPGGDGGEPASWPPQIFWEGNYLRGLFLGNSAFEDVEVFRAQFYNGRNGERATPINGEGEDAVLEIPDPPEPPTIGFGGSGTGGTQLASPWEFSAGSAGGSGAGGSGGPGGKGGGGGGGGAGGQGEWIEPFPSSIFEATAWAAETFTNEVLLKRVLKDYLEERKVGKAVFKGITSVETGAGGGDGAYGAAGYQGGSGGNGGDGGNSGAGGGALRVIAQGRIDFGGITSVRGGNGTGGTGGEAAPPITPAFAGENTTTLLAATARTFGFGFGRLFSALAELADSADRDAGRESGDGGTHGFGGMPQVGSEGAAGGEGAGGAAGTIILQGTEVGGIGTFDLRGGNTYTDPSPHPDPGTHGDNGKLYLATNALEENTDINNTLIGAGAFNTLAGGTLASTTRLGPLVPNPFIFQEPETPTIPGLIGGAEAFGFAGTASDPFFNVVDDPGNPVTIGGTVVSVSGGTVVTNADFSSLSGRCTQVDFTTSGGTLVEEVVSLSGMTLVTVDDVKAEGLAAGDPFIVREFGSLQFPLAGGTATTKSLLAATPQNAVAVAARVDVGPPGYPDYPGYDYVFVINALSSATLTDIFFGCRENIIDANGDVDDPQPFHAKFPLQGGWQFDPDFDPVSNSGGDQVSTQLGPQGIFVFLVPEDEIVSVSPEETATLNFNLSVTQGDNTYTLFADSFQNGDLLCVTFDPDVPVRESVWEGTADEFWNNPDNWLTTGPDLIGGTTIVPNNTTDNGYNVTIGGTAFVKQNTVIAIDRLTHENNSELGISASLILEKFGVRPDAGVIENNGIIVLDPTLETPVWPPPAPLEPTASLRFSGTDILLTGNGTILLFTPTTPPPDNEPTEPVIDGLRSSDSIINDTDHTIRGAGILGNNSLNITNNGSIIADDFGFLGLSLTIDPAGDRNSRVPGFINNGTLRLANSTINVSLGGGAHTYQSSIAIPTLVLKDGFFQLNSGPDAAFGWGPYDPSDFGSQRILQIQDAKLRGQATPFLNSLPDAARDDAALTAGPFEEDEFNFVGSNIIENLNLRTSPSTIEGSPTPGVLRFPRNSDTTFINSGIKVGEIVYIDYDGDDEIDDSVTTVSVGGTVQGGFWTFENDERDIFGDPRNPLFDAAAMLTQDTVNYDTTTQFFMSVGAARFGNLTVDGGYRFSQSDQEEAAFLGNSFQFPIDHLTVGIRGTTLIGTIVNNGLFSGGSTVKIENEVALTGTGGWEMNDKIIAGDGVGGSDRLIVGISQVFHEPVFDIDGLLIENIGTLHAAATTYNSPPALGDLIIINDGTIRPVGPFGGGTIDNTNGIIAVGGDLNLANSTDLSIPAFENLRLIGGTITQSPYWAGVSATALGTTTAARADTFNTDFVETTFASPLFQPLTADQFITALETSPVPNPASLGHFHLANVPLGASPAQAARFQDVTFKTHALLPHAAINGTIAIDPGAVVVAGKLDLQNGNVFFDFDESAPQPATFILSGLNASPATDEIALTGPSGTSFTIPAGLDFRANGVFGDDRVRIINQGTLRQSFSGGTAQTLTFDPVGDFNSSPGFFNQGIIATPSIARAFPDQLIFNDGHYNNAEGIIELPSQGISEINDSLIVGGILRGAVNPTLVEMTNSTLRNVQLENIELIGSFTLEEVTFVAPSNDTVYLAGDTTFVGNSVLQGSAANPLDFFVDILAIGNDSTDRLTITEDTRVEAYSQGTLTSLINAGELLLQDSNYDGVTFTSDQVDSGDAAVAAEDAIYLDFRTGQLDASLIDLGILTAGETLNAESVSAVKNSGLIEVDDDLILDAAFFDNSGGTLIVWNTLQSKGALIDNTSGLIQVEDSSKFGTTAFSYFEDTVMTGGTLTGNLGPSYQEPNLFIGNFAGPDQQSVTIFSNLSLQAPLTVLEGVLLLLGESDLGQDPVTHGRIVNFAKVTLGGSLTSSGGSLLSGITENRGVVEMAGGTTDVVVSFAASTVTGSGTIGDLQLTQQGSGGKSKLRSSLRGTTQGDTYDYLQTQTFSSVGADLEVVLEDDFMPCGSDVFTVLTTGAPILATDFTVANGGFVDVTDGDTGELVGTMQINYGTGNADPNSLVLTNFEPDGVIYVDLSASTGLYDGSSWTFAFQGLEDAFAYAGANPGTVKQIWVAAGTYTPGTLRTDSFELPPGILVYGGFPANGGGPSCTRDPNPATNGTILSGDIGTPNVISDNSYHVVDALTSDTNSLLDGFTITGGNSSDASGANSLGGGITLGRQSPRLSNVSFIENRAKFGGALHANKNLTLLMHLDLDEDPASDGDNTVLADSSGNGNTGRLVNNNGSNDKSVPGQIGNALDFDGTNDQVDATAFDVNNTFSIAMWVNPDSIANGQAFIGKHASTGANQILFGFYSGGYHFNIRNLNFEYGTPSTGWQHLAVVCTDVGTSTRVTIYKNGAILGPVFTEIPIEAGNVAGGKGWTIGQDWDSSTSRTDHFNGRIDEVSVWNGALSAADVAKLYQLDRADFVYANTGAAELTNVAFLGNHSDIAGGSGGAVYLTNSAAPTFTNALFAGNYSSNLGGAMRAFNSDPTFTNSTFAYNDSPSGDAFYLDGGSSPLLFNSIFWGNTPANFAGSGAPDASSSDNLIEGAAISGYVTANTDPLFLSSPDPGDGDWTTPADNDYGNLRFGPDSPAFALGDPAAIPPGVTTDLDSNPREIPFGLELGAYEIAMISPFGQDVDAPISDGTQFTLPNWAPDATTYNDGAGLNFAFTPTAITGSLTFDVDPTVDPDGTLRFTLAEGTLGTATFDVVASDPGGLHPDSDPVTFTISSGTIHYVDKNAPGPTHDGTSWANAFLHLHEAMDAAGAKDDIWVAQGTYKPDEGPAQTPGDATAYFDLPYEVDLYGGFPTSGGNGTFGARDPATYPTILSGDLSDDDDAPGGSNAENSLGVLVCVIPSGSQRVVRTVDGFTIKGATSFGAIGFNGSMSISHCIFEGNTAASSGGATTIGSGSIATFSFCVFDSNSANFGGALQINSGGNAEFTDCQFTSNTAGQGAAIYNNSAENPTFTRCTFESNAASSFGGAVFNRSTATATFDSCLFTANTGSRAGSGGAVYNASSASTFTGCTFASNFAGSGAGIYNTAASPLITSCVFEGNDSVRGGGIANVSGSSPSITNSAFQGNKADIAGGALYNDASSPVVTNSSFQGNDGDFGGGAVHNIASSNPAFANSIIWLNRGVGNSNTAPTASVLNDSSTPTYAHCLVQNIDLTGTGIGNFDGTDPANDPLFAVSLNPVLAPETGGNLRLLPASPVIGQGLNSANASPTDLDGNNRLAGANIDLGPYELAITFTLLFPGADPLLDGDGNGLPDFYDYAAGGDLADPPLLYSATGNLYFQATRRTEATDIFTQYQKSTNLVDWFPMIENVDYIINTTTSLAPGIEQISIRLLLTPNPITNRLFFFRQTFSDSPPAP